MATELVVLQGLLRGLAERLADTTEVKAVADAMLPAAAEALGADLASIAMRVDERSLRVVSSVGMPTHMTDPWAEFDVSAAVPIAKAVRDCAPVWIPVVADAREEFPALPAESISTSAAALPLRDGDRVIGVLGIGWSRQRVFDEADRQLLLAVAALAAAACARHPLPQAPRLRPHRHDSVAGVHIACLAREDGARCTVKQPRAGSGSGVVFATILDADPRLPSATLDAVGGVLGMLRRHQVPPALVGQAIAELTEDRGEQVTGAHIELAPQSAWIAVAPLDATVVVASTASGQGQPLPPSQTSLAGERVVLAGEQNASVLAITVDTATDETSLRTIADIAAELMERSPAATAPELLELLTETLHRSETTPCVRGALAVSLDARPDIADRSRRLPARPVATQLGRRFAIAALPDDADVDVGDSIELITDELVANAVRHARDDVVVTIVDEETGTLIAVSDDDDRVPDRMPVTADAESGRGLLVIEALADQMGTSERELGGKWVWARIRWRLQPS